jgi:hypothetical protein
MEPAPGRRLSRLAATLWVAPPALAAVWAWGEPVCVRPYCAYAALTAALLLLAEEAGRLRRWS